MTGDKLYVYGVIEADDIEADEVAVETTGVGGATEFTAVEHRDLAAVVSSIDTTEPESTDEAVGTHDEVLREIMDVDGGRGVVPMSFGMAFENERALENVLRGARPAFRRALNEVADAVELGLKVVRDPGASVDGDAVQETVENRLEPLYKGSVENGLFSDRLVVNRSYLVAADRRETFDEAIDDLVEELPDGLAVHYTGPWAPYSFVDINVGAEGR